MTAGYRVVSPTKPECPGGEGEPALDTVRWRYPEHSQGRAVRRATWSSGEREVCAHGRGVGAMTSKAVGEIWSDECQGPRLRILS